MKKDLEIVKALIREMNEELKGGQKKLDVAEPFGKITGADFKALRAKKGMDEADYPTEKWAEWGSIYNQGKAAGWEAGYNQGWNDCENGKEKRPNIALKETEDHEVSMANNSIDSILWAANELKKHLQGGERDIPAWIQDHITNAENYILQAAKNYHEYGAEEAPESENTVNEYGDDSGGQDMSWGMYNRGTQKNNGGNLDFMKKGYEDYYDGVPFNKCPYEHGKNKYYKIDLANYWEAGWMKAQEEDTESESELNEMSLSAIMEAKEKNVKEGVKKVGKKYAVYSKKGKRLGTHTSKAKAKKQMAAIEISKQGK